MSLVDNLDNIEQKYKDGYAVFEKLFKLNDKKLVAKLKSMLIDEFPGVHSVLSSTTINVTRTIHNEKYKSITIEFYDLIEINAFGISFKPEHGKSASLMKFSKHIKV